MTTFPLSLAALDSLATLMHSTPVSKATRETTPILTAIHLHVTPLEWVATATDRYIVAEITAPLGDIVHTIPADGVSLQLDSADIVSVAKLAKTRVGRTLDRDLPVVDLTFEDNTGAVSVELWGETIATIRTIPGNFPPVSRLFPDDHVAHALEVIALDPVKLARVHKVLTPNLVDMTPAARADSALHMRFTALGDRPGPVVLTRRGESGLRALIQPNLILS